MSINIIDHRTVIDEADTTTDWTGNTAVFTAQPTPVESTGCLGAQVSTETQDLAHTLAAPTNLTNRLIYIWSQNRAALDTLVNGGIGIFLSDGTNDISFHVAGSDAAGFRYEAGPVTWQNHIMDTSRPPTNTTARAGTLAAFNSASITDVGLTFKTLAKSVGGAENCFIDIIRVGNPTINNGAMQTLTSGSASDPITFFDWAFQDRQTGNLEAYSIIRALGVGAYALQGSFRVGDPTGSVTAYFENTDDFVQFEDRGLNFERYSITVVQGTGTTTFNLGSKTGTGNTATGGGGVTFTVPTGVGGTFDSGTSGSDASVNIYGSTFNGFTGGFTLGNGHEFIDNGVNGSGTIFPSSSLMYNTNVGTSIASSSLYWDETFDPNGYLDNMTFVGSGSTNHAIEFGPNSPTSMSLNNIAFTNYGLAETSASALFNNSGKDLHITVLGDESPPTVRNAGALSTTLITNVRTLTLENIVSGSEVSLVNQNTGAEIDHLESVDTDGLYTYSYSYTEDIPVYAFVHAVQYVWQSIPITLGNADQTVTVQQQFDRNYKNPA